MSSRTSIARLQGNGRVGAAGFTLIELLVVVAIIGILATIVMASLGAARSKGRDAKRISDIKNLKVALELYSQANSYHYPGALSGLSSYMAGGVVPTDPGTGSNYFYAAPGPAVANCTASTYHLGAKLENGNPVLANDADDPAGSGAVCTGGVRFAGSSTDCGSSSSSPDYCFDLIQ